LLLQLGLTIVALIISWIVFKRQIRDSAAQQSTLEASARAMNSSVKLAEKTLRLLEQQYEDERALRSRRPRLAIQIDTTGVAWNRTTNRFVVRKPFGMGANVDFLFRNVGDAPATGLVIFVVSVPDSVIVNPEGMGRGRQNVLQLDNASQAWQPESLGAGPYVIHVRLDFQGAVVRRFSLHVRYSAAGIKVDARRFDFELVDG